MGKKRSEINTLNDLPQITDHSEDLLATELNFFA